MEKNKTCSWRKSLCTERIIEFCQILTWGLDLICWLEQLVVLLNWLLETGNLLVYAKIPELTCHTVGEGIWDSGRWECWTCCIMYILFSYALSIPFLGVPIKFTFINALSKEPQIPLKNSLVGWRWWRRLHNEIGIYDSMGISLYMGLRAKRRI